MLKKIEPTGAPNACYAVPRDMVVTELGDTQVLLWTGVHSRTSTIHSLLMNSENLRFIVLFHATLCCISAEPHSDGGCGLLFRVIFYVGVLFLLV